MSVGNYISAESIVRNLYEQFRQMPILSWEHPERGLHCVFDVHAAEYGYRMERQQDGTEKEVHHPDWEVQAHAYLHVIVTSRHRLYVAESQEYKPEAVPIDLWINASNHDSCWSSGLKFDDWYFWACKYVEDLVPEEHKRAPYQVHLNGRFGGFVSYPGLNFVKITREDIEGEHYFDRLTKVELLKFKIDIEE